jgi:protein ImuB
VTAVRTLVLHVRDWPVVAAGATPEEPAAVFHANRVVAATPAARAEGVATGMRRRESQARCPELAVLDHDPGRDARAFEPVVAALAERLAPRIEVVAPGHLAFGTRGPSRYFGGDAALAALAADLAAGVLGRRGTPLVGIADGPFPALLAALATTRDDADAGSVDAVAPSAQNQVVRAEGGRHDLLLRTRPRSARHRDAAAGWPAPVVVPPLGSPAFLAPHPVDALALAGVDADLLDVLRRLGLRTLGAVAAVDPGDVAGRFGTDGTAAHRLAAGRDERPPATAPPPVDLAARAELDPPAERVETAAFVARGLADELARRLDGDGLACTRLLIAAETEHGERLERLWRGEGAGGAAALTAGAIADRVRWQLDGWLRSATNGGPTAGAPTVGAPTVGATNGGPTVGAPTVGAPTVGGSTVGGSTVGGSTVGGSTVGAPTVGESTVGAPTVGESTVGAPTVGAPTVGAPTAGITLLELVPDEVVPAVGRQLGFWGGATGADERAVRAVARVAGLLGLEAVSVPEWRGGRSAAEQVVLVPAAAVDLAAERSTPPLPSPGATKDPGASCSFVVAPASARSPAGGPREGPPPWPGALPAPAPTVLVDRTPAEVTDPDGTPVAVTGRGVLTGAPARMQVGTGRWTDVTAWAGPWPIEERWWDPVRHRRRARLQVLDAHGVARLLSLEGGRWWVEAVYD